MTVMCLIWDSGTTTRSRFASSMAADWFGGVIQIGRLSAMSRFSASSSVVRKEGTFDHAVITEPEGDPWHGTDGTLSDRVHPHAVVGFELFK